MPLSGKKEKLPKKEHYVPKHYLRLFCGGDVPIWVYNKRNGKVYQTNIDDTGSRDHLYETLWWNSPNGERYLIQGHIEKKTLHDIEEAQAPVIRRVVSKLNLAILPCGGPLALSVEEREAVAAFLAITLCRNPVVMDAFLSAKPDGELNDELFGYKDLVEQMGLGDFESFEEHGIKTALTKFGDGSIPNLVLERTKGMSLSFAVAEPGSSFVTSTQPVFYEMGGEGETITYLSMPLTPRFTAYLSTNPEASALVNLPREGVDQLNFMYADSRNEQVEAVISTSRETLEQLKRRNNEGIDLPHGAGKVVAYPHC